MAYDTPSSLILFVTGVCNAGCQHCFYRSSLNQSDDALGIDTLSRLLNSLSRKCHLSLTGGEPFTRKDIDDIIKEALSCEMVSSLAVNTNAYLTDKINPTLDKLKNCNKPVYFQLSLDGLKETHDKNRQLRGCFDRVISIAERIESLSRDNPMLSYSLSVTLMKDNLRDVEDMMQFFSREGIKSKITLLRGNSFSSFLIPGQLMNPEYGPASAAASEDEIRGLIDRIRMSHPTYLSELNIKKIDLALKILNAKKRISICHAGDNDGVIYHNGDIGICEQVVPFGNMRNWDWNLYKAWNSDEADNHRKQLTKCACIHGCNLSTTIQLGKGG